MHGQNHIKIVKSIGLGPTLFPRRMCHMNA